MKDKIENILIKLGSLDRRVIFIIIALSVTIPLIKPNWVALPIVAKPETIKVFNELEQLGVCSNFEYRDFPVDCIEDGFCQEFYNDSIGIGYCSNIFSDYNGDEIYDEQMICDVRDDIITDPYNQNNVCQAEANSQYEEKIISEKVKSKCIPKTTKCKNKVLISFEYGPSTMPEIHPMSIALLRHLFSKDILIYGFALWPDGNFMSIDAFSEVATEMNKEYDEHYVNLGYKPGGEAVIKGIASNIRNMYTVDLLGNDIGKLKLMNRVKNISDFDYVISLSAGDPGSKQWVQFATDPKSIPFTTGCTSIQVTDIIPYVETNQIRGILAGMPGAAEYESLVYDAYKEYNFIGEATGMMSAQSISHIAIVLFIIFGNITYFILRKREKE